MARALVLGGGFGGLAAAHELRRLLAADDEIVVVSESDRFFMGFAKLWDLAQERPLDGGTRMLGDIEKHGIRFVHGWISAIDGAGRRATTTAGELEGDAMLVALGAGPAHEQRQLLDNAADAYDLYDAAHLPSMHQALDAVDSGRVVVSILGGPFKCPPAPYEAALLVDDRLRRRGVRDRVQITVTTFQPMTIPTAGPDASRYVASFLSEAGIELLSGKKVTGVDGEARAVALDDGSSVEYTVLLGVPANAPPPVIAESGLTGASGWIEPDRFTMRTPVERVYAVGDCTMIPNAAGQLPKAGVFAAAEGTIAARNIARDLGAAGAGAEEARFDGHGMCYLELPGHRVAFVEGNFYGEPAPDVHLTEADEEHFRRKQAYERDRLAEWFD